MSYVILNLYPPLPINKALHIFTDQLNSDKDNLMRRTKYCLKNTYELIEPCLCKFYFTWNNDIRVFTWNNDIRGSIESYFVVILSRSYIQNLVYKTIAEALALNLA